MAVYTADAATYVKGPRSMGSSPKKATLRDRLISLLVTVERIRSGFERVEDSLFPNNTIGGSSPSTPPPQQSVGGLINQLEDVVASLDVTVLRMEEGV